MPAPKERPSKSSPGTVVQRAHDAMPKHQRVAVFYIGLTLMLGSVTLSGVLFLRETAGIPALVFLGLVFFVGFLMAVPRAAIWLLNHVPLPNALKRKLNG